MIPGLFMNSHREDTLYESLFGIRNPERCGRRA
jgi:hypothetical protein